MVRSIPDYTLLNIDSRRAPGALRTGGAALYEPYTDNPSTSGVLRIPPDVLHEIIPKFLADGWQVVRSFLLTRALVWLMRHVFPQNTRQYHEPNSMSYC